MAVRLDLQLIDASDSTPVPGAVVRVNPHESGERFVSDGAGLARIELASQPRHLSLRVRRDGYVPKLLTWDLALVGVASPEHYTLKMERAHTIGGLVRNQLGEPVAGARVLLTLRGSSSEGGAQPRIHSDIFECPVKCDAEGRWQYIHAPAQFAHIHVRLAHPDYVSRVELRPQPPAEEFWKGTATLTLERGVPCEGTVTDAEGAPLAGVRVTLGEGGNDSTRKDNRRTDGQGRFRFGGISFKNYSEPQILSFQKRGYAPELITLQPASEVVRVNAVLRPGTALRVRFVDKLGAPVPGVTMAMSGWRSHRPFHCRFQADDHGVAVWEHAPADEIGFWILKEGYERDEVKLTAGEWEQTVVMKRPLQISGRVIDARTRQPIPRFSLIRGGGYPPRQGLTTSKQMYWNHHWVFPFENGEYRTALGDPVISRNRDGTVHQEGFRKIRVSAPGYAPAASRAIGNDETEDIVCDFELEPADGVSGSVKDGEGRPVEGAEIVVGTGGNGVFVSDGKIHGRGDIVLKSDAEGRYTLPPQEQDYAVVFMHPQAGYRVTSCGALKAAPQIVLQAWGRIELLTTSAPGGRPKYHVQERTTRGDWPRVRFNSSGAVSADGTVIFDRLPAGTLQLYTEDRSARDGDNTVTVEPGQTVRLDRRAGRRAVVGQIAIPPEGIALEEPLARLSLRRHVPPGTAPDQRRGSSFDASFRLDAAGKFRVDDLAPGLYVLTGIFFRSLPQRDQPPDVAGLAHKEFELPPGEGPFDLGIIPLRPGDGVQFRTCGPSGCGPAA